MSILDETGTTSDHLMVNFSLPSVTRGRNPPVTWEKFISRVFQFPKEAVTENNEDTDDKMREIDGKIATTLMKKQREAFEKELRHLRELKNSKGNAALVFKLKEKILIRL